MSRKAHFMKQDESLHLITGPRARGFFVNFAFDVKDAENGLSIQPIGPVGPDPELEAAGGPGGGINYDLAYAVVIPKQKVYRITYHYHWDGHDHNYIGFYDQKRDINYPMYYYTGGSGYGSREFDIPAQEEDLTYIIYGQYSFSIFPGHSPWYQLPAKLVPASTNTVSFGPDPSQKSAIGWLSWGILN